jgi:excisionase family DNA binding protein
VRELAERLELDVKTVYAAAHRGEIPTIVIGRRILIPACWLEQKLIGQQT